MSTKRMARSVHDGKLVTFEVPGRKKEIVGYLAGMDSYHWFVLTADCHEHLIHKTGVLVSIASESTYAAETRHADLEAVIAPFRSRLAEDRLIPQSRLRSTTASERTA